MAGDEERLAALHSVATTNDPKLKRLERVDSLTAAPARTMSEMTSRETIYFALIEGLHRSKIVSLPGTVCFFELLRENRVSLDRKGRTEYLQALIGTSVHEQVGTPGSLPDDLGGADTKKWWQIWKHGGDS